ncbi:MAG: transketolase [Anaerolineae bacterium]|nr:transketolase [Anaerolineae bacterium]
MRKAFTQTLAELAESDPRIIVLTADLGFGLFEALSKRCPDQFVNVGVAEATMTGMAAGLALQGRIPFTYSIVPFATARCYEQIRNDVCYQNANVKIVGVGAGYAYGPNGPTHHGIVDAAIMRALPNMTVLSPADPIEADLATRAAVAHQGPVYLRLGRGGEPVLHASPPDFRIGRGIILREGQEATLIATGSIVSVALDAAVQLEAQGIGTRVVSMPTVKPLDVALVEACVRESRVVVTLEEHTVAGGLGSAVAEAAAAIPGVRAPVRIFGIPDRFAHTVGDQAYLRELDGLTTSRIVDAILDVLATS